MFIAGENDEKRTENAATNRDAERKKDILRNAVYGPNAEDENVSGGRHALQATTTRRRLSSGVYACGVQWDGIILKV